MEMGYPQKGHGTSGSIMEWRYTPQQAKFNRHAPVKLYYVRGRKDINFSLASQYGQIDSSFYFGVYLSTSNEVVIIHDDVCGFKRLNGKDLIYAPAGSWYRCSLFKCLITLTYEGCVFIPSVFPSRNTMRRYLKVWWFVWHWYIVWTTLFLYCLKVSLVQLLVQ